MSETKILPCPFCGGGAKKMKGITIAGEAKWFDVGCSNEMCSGHKRVCLFEAESEAIEAWNTRKPIDDIVERLEEEKELNLQSKAVAKQCCFMEAMSRCDAKSYAFDKAIDIVRNAGKEGAE